MGMDHLTIKHQIHRNSTLIENEFIDNYMVKANGEYVKVYLFLLRHLNNPCSVLTLSTIADCLETSERDIHRALRHWTLTDLLVIEKDASGTITGLELKTPSLTGSGQPAKVEEKPTLYNTSVPSIHQYKNHKELKNILFVAEQYLGKTLSKTDVEVITYFYDTLHFSADLIEYLIEYCVENNHKSIHYIKKVGLSWHDQEIITVDQARTASTAYNKNCYTVLKAFGISGRGPATAEINYINKWTEEYGFTTDIIKEACNRTIAGIHRPSFEYTDTILKNWLNGGVRHHADIERIDVAFKNSKNIRKKTISKPVTKSKFNNFEGRSYDMDNLEKQLLNR